MSRGSKIYYLNTHPTVGSESANINAQINPEIAQAGDIAISLQVNAANNITTNHTVNIPAPDAYQHNGTAWVLIANGETAWTDPNIIANVTKIRLAHTIEQRNYANFVQRVYGKRYGDTWYNAHNFSSAVLEWYSENDIARIYMANYGPDTDYLTIECGDGVTDKVRFVNRTPSSSTTVTNIWDMAGDEVRSYVQAFFQLDATMMADFYVNGSTELSGDVQMLTTMTAIGDANFSSDVIVAEAIRPSISPGDETDRGIEWDTNTRIISDGSGNLNIRATASGKFITLHVPGINDLLINYGGTIKKILHEGHEGSGGGIDSDTLDGMHLAQIIAQIATITENGTPFLAYNGTVVGTSLNVQINGTDYFIPSSLVQEGSCYCDCYYNCHSNCHIEKMCHVYTDDESGEK